MNEMSRKTTLSRDVGGRKTMVQELADLSAVVVAPVDD